VIFITGESQTGARQPAFNSLTTISLNPKHKFYISKPKIVLTYVILPFKIDVHNNLTNCCRFKSQQVNKLS